MTREELKTKTIGVLMGGLSAERDVSLKSGRAMAGALRSRGYRVIEIDVDRNLPALLTSEGIDVAVIALHGRFGEDGCVQGVLELLGIPYTGSGVMASALAMNKIFARQLFAASGLTVARCVVVRRGESFDPGTAPFPLPMVVKPSQEGSSMGITIVRSPHQLASALQLAHRYDAEALVEEFISGREIQIGILENEAIGAIEIVPKNEFYDFEAKYTQGGAEHIIPPRISAPILERALETGKKAHLALGCFGYSRVDLLVQECGLCYVLEVNTLPGMTATSLLPEIAQAAGIDFQNLVERILATAIGQG
jgi:D-alanine-D-alanine ligase